MALSAKRKPPALSPEYRAEFDEMNSRYNCKAATALSVVIIVILGATLLAGYIAYSSGEQGIGEIALTMPYQIGCIAVSVAALVLLRIFGAKNPFPHRLCDAVSFLQVSIIMVFMLVSSHVEIPEIGIKNINVIIIVMFAVSAVVTSSRSWGF